MQITVPFGYTSMDSMVLSELILGGIQMSIEW